MGKRPHSFLLLVVALSLAGCACTVPYTGQGLNPQISRGKPNTFLDGLGAIPGAVFKVLLLSKRMCAHCISPDTEEVLVDYIAAVPPHETAFHDTLFRLNQYAPLDDLRRLGSNHHVAWPYRFTLGLLETLVFEVLPISHLLGGDHYNPFTNTVHVYADHSAVLLHEAGHAYNTSQQRWKGTSAFLYFFLVPFVLFEEYTASERAIQYFVVQGDRKHELEAYKILYPAYATYLGASFPIPFGNFIGLIPGHIWGRLKARSRARYYQTIDAASSLPLSPQPASP